MEYERFLLCFVTLVIGINAEGQFAVLHTPPAFQFVGAIRIRETSLKDIFCVALGLSTDQTSTWNEMKLVNPFETPEAAVVVYVDGVSSIGPFDDDAKVYPLSMDSFQSDTYNQVINRILKLREPRCNLINMGLSSEYALRMYSYIFGEYTNYKLPELTLKHLKYIVEQDYRFLRELQALNAITAAIKSGVLKPDGILDFYMFKFSTLHTLSEHYGPDSMKTMEAKTLLNQQIRDLNKAYVASYAGNILFTVVASDGSVDVHRRRRDFRNKLMQRNLYKKIFVRSTAPEERIAITNIIFWMCLSLYFAMLAIVYVMISLDPGRDSIVYRMTSAIDRVKME